ncbi:MAG: hypothetical protein JNL21_38175 [Myxococcales bacterium]|nr:hypothetical protein [Myxococcales bacterium]
MLRSVARRSLPVLVAALSAGCAFRTPTPELPEELVGSRHGPAQLDVTEVAVTDSAGDVDSETQAAVRTQTVKILEDAARKSTTGGAPSLVRVSVVLDEHHDYAASAVATDGLAVFAWFLLAPAGVTFDRQSLWVEVEVDSAGRRFVGRGHADREGSIYAPARKRALAVALSRALADAAREGAM